MHSATAVAAVKSGGDFLETIGEIIRAQIIHCTVYSLQTEENQIFTLAISERMKHTCPVTLATLARKSRCQDLNGLVDPGFNS